MSHVTLCPKVTETPQTELGGEGKPTGQERVSVEPEALTWQILCVDGD